MTERDEAQDAAERTFAILTARYHDLPEYDSLLAELTLEQAVRVIRLMASLLRGTFTFAENLNRRPAGSVLPRVVERLREAAPWMH